MRPNPSSSFRSPFGEAVREGLRAAWQNGAAMLALLAAMSALVGVYYCWPAAAAVLSSYGTWQHSGGLLRAGLASGFAAGILSELSVIYVADRGRWNRTHVENMVFRFTTFFMGGMVVYEFYNWQAVWFGTGVSWRVILPKVLVDQFVFSVFWSTSYQTLAFRWQALRYSGSRLWSELDGKFVIKRMLPVLVTNWMFWIPGVILVYSMPLDLQMPINIFAMAIWSLLLAGLSRPARARQAQIAPTMVLTRTEPVADPVE